MLQENIYISVTFKKIDDTFLKLKIESLSEIFSISNNLEISSFEQAFNSKNKLSNFFIKSLLSDLEHIIKGDINLDKGKILIKI